MSEIRSLQWQEEEARINYIATVLEGAGAKEIAEAKAQWDTATLVLQNGTFDYVQSIL